MQETMRVRGEARHLCEEDDGGEHAGEGRHEGGRERTCAVGLVRGCRTSGRGSAGATCARGRDTSGAGRARCGRRASRTRRRGRAAHSGESREDVARLVGDAVGGRRGEGRVGQAGDGAERLGWLGVGEGLSVLDVHTGEPLVVRVACLENAWLSRVGAGVLHADAIVDVLAVVGRVGVGGVARLEAGLVVTDEIVPFDDLLPGVVAAGTAYGELERVDEATERVTALRIRNGAETEAVNLEQLSVGKDL